MTKNHLPNTIPLFPLTGNILLPKGHLPLNIFEPRYKDMVNFARKTDNLIGMVQPANTPIKTTKLDNDNFGTAPRGRPLYQVGCAGLISDFEKTDTDQYFIILTGIKRFKIERELNSEYAFRQAMISYDDYNKDGEDVIDENSYLKDEFFRTLKEYLTAFDIKIDLDSLEDADIEELINSIAMICPFEASEKQMLLETVLLKDRLQTMMNMIKINLRGQNLAPGNLVH